MNDKYFDLKVGFTCTNDCIHCVVADKRFVKDIDINKIKELIMKNKDYNFIVTGGEPTINKDILEILHFMKYEAKVSRIIMQTMARPMKDFNFAKEINQYIDFFLVAIHSYDHIIHDRITKRVGSWEETIAAIYNLERLGANINSQTVISKLNMNDLSKTYDFILKDLNIRDANLTFPHANGNAKTNIKIVMPNYSEIQNEVTTILKNLNDKNTMFIEAIPRCVFNNFDEYLNKNIIFFDDIKDEVIGYDASNTNNGEMNYNISIDSDKRKYEFCNQCKYNNVCSGVWKEYHEYYENSGLSPIK